MQVVSGTLTTEFSYNGAGDRVAKTVNGVTTDYVLDPAAGLTQVLVESTGGQQTAYLYGHDLLAQYDSGTWAYHINDGLGSVRQLADLAGEVVQSYSFSPFGVPLGESGGEPYGFTGEQWDASTGLVYLRARYYDAQTGRFLTPDTFPGFATKPQTFNAYPYTTNNPATLVDPSGYQGGGAGVLEWSFECLLSNPTCQAAAAEAVAIVAVTVETVGPYVLIAGPPLAMMYLSIKYGYWPEPTVEPRPAPAPPEAPPTEEPWGTPPAPPPLSPDGTRPMDMRPQPQPAPAPEPQPAPQPRIPDPIVPPCPRETLEPDPRRLVEVGAGGPEEWPTAFELLYWRYNLDYDEFVAVDPHGDLVDLLQRFGRLPPDPRIYQWHRRLAELPNNFADFLFSMAPGPELAKDITQGHLQRVAKGGALIYVILEQRTVNNTRPDLLDYLRIQGYAIKEHNKHEVLADNNLLGLPFESVYIKGVKWWEAYK